MEGCSPPTGKGSGHCTVPRFYFLFFFGSNWAIFVQRIFLCSGYRGEHRPLPPPLNTPVTVVAVLYRLRLMQNAGVNNKLTDGRQPHISLATIDVQASYCYTQIASSAGNDGASCKNG